jgi:hypothetical protein
MRDKFEGSSWGIDLLKLFWKILFLYLYIFANDVHTEAQVRITILRDIHFFLDLNPHA